MSNPGYIEQVRDGVLGWLESVRHAEEGWGRWPYHAKMEAPWALQASGLAIKILDELGALTDVDATRKAEAVAFFSACQDPADGLFKDPLETEDRHTDTHSWEQVWGQRHGSALAALRLLGAEPLHPLPAAQFIDLRKGDAYDITLNRIDWRYPWHHGESWYRAIGAYMAGLPESQRNDREPRIARAFEAVEAEILDPATGTPSRRMPEPDASVAMAGLFKVMFAYEAVGRAVPHAQRAIDSTLALQHADGEFGFRDNMCMHWDALWVLRALDRQLAGGYRHEDIVEAGNRTARRLLDHYRKPDGGFAFHGAHCQTNHHSIRLCREAHPIGDMLGTTMSLNCLTYADAWNGGAGD